MLSEKLNNAMTASAVRVQTEIATLKSRAQTAVEEKEFGVPVWFIVLAVVLFSFAVIEIVAASMFCQWRYGNSFVAGVYPIDGGWRFKVGCGE